MNREFTKEQVTQVGKCQRLKPGEKEFEAAGLPIRRRYRPDGQYEWRSKIKTKDSNGKLSKHAHIMGELMKPFMVADTERHAINQEKLERVRVRDCDGGVRTLDPALADGAVRTHGWGHVWRAGGLKVERGVMGDMLWRWGYPGWEPLGVRCFGEPLFGGTRTVSRRGLQLDPDGNAWRWIDKAWRMIDGS